LKNITDSARFLRVKVKPNARASSFAESANEVWVAQIKSPPEGGKANEELIGLVARHFSCSKSSVTIKSGLSSRTKLVKIESK
jgi:uncharacterized protein